MNTNFIGRSNLIDIYQLIFFTITEKAKEELEQIKCCELKYKEKPPCCILDQKIRHIKFIDMSLEQCAWSKNLCHPILINLLEEIIKKDIMEHSKISTSATFVLFIESTRFLELNEDDICDTIKSYFLERIDQDKKSLVNKSKELQYKKMKTNIEKLDDSSSELDLYEAAESILCFQILELIDQNPYNISDALLMLISHKNQIKKQYITKDYLRYYYTELYLVLSSFFPELYARDQIINFLNIEFRKECSKDAAQKFCTKILKNYKIQIQNLSIIKKIEALPDVQNENKNQGLQKINKIEKIALLYFVKNFIEKSEQLLSFFKINKEPDSESILIDEDSEIDLLQPDIRVLEKFISIMSNQNITKFLSSFIQNGILLQTNLLQDNIQDFLDNLKKIFCNFAQYVILYNDNYNELTILLQAANMLLTEEGSGLLEKN